MNILGFLALGHLDASTFAIIAQMKVFSTALFSVLILNRQLAPRKWRALATLTLDGASGWLDVWCCGVAAASGAPPAHRWNVRDFFRGPAAAG